MPGKYLIALFFMTFAGAGHALQTECPPECTIDTMEIVTWYPSPYNEYEELRLYPISVSNSECNDDNRGLMYYDKEDNKVKLCKGSAGLNDWLDLGGDYWKPSTSNSNDIYYTQSGNVGIGTQDPTTKLEVVGDIRATKDNGSTSFIAESYPLLANKHSSFIALRARGSKDSPSYPRAGDALAAFIGRDAIDGIVVASGYGGASMYMMAAENFSLTKKGTYTSFQTTEIGTNAPVERMRISDNGYVGIGTTNPTEKLEVAGRIKITGGSPGAGKVLTSDDSGLAT